MSDAVIEELRRIKDDMAREYGYDVPQIAADLQGSHGEEGHRIVDLQPLRQAAEQGVLARRRP